MILKNEIELINYLQKIFEDIGLRKFCAACANKIANQCCCGKCEHRVRTGCTLRNIGCVMHLCTKAKIKFPELTKYLDSIKLEYDHTLKPTEVKTWTSKSH